MSFQELKNQLATYFDSLERAALVFPCALFAFMVSFILVFLHSSLYSHVPPVIYHLFLLVSYYGAGLVVAPNRRPTIAALLALITVLPWTIGGSNHVGQSGQRRSDEGEELLFLASFGILAIVTTTLGALIASKVRRNSKICN